MVDGHYKEALRVIHVGGFNLKPNMFRVIIFQITIKILHFCVH